MNRKLRSTTTRLAAVLALTLAGSAFAQGVTGSAVTGTVTKQDGTPIENAFVQLRNPATGETFNAVSSKSGAYNIDHVPAGGPYVLTAAAEGFQPLSQPDIQLDLGQRLAADIKLRTSLTEEIAVTAHRLDSLADHNRTGASTVVKGTTITEIPLQGRNFTDLLSTDPRISGNSIGGQNNRFNNIQIDGGANNDLFGLAGNGTPGGQSNAKPLSIEAIQQFVVQVAPFDVRQGMFAGGLVNAITKSGTNDFHGSLFGYFQNKALTRQSATINGTYFADDPTYNNFNTMQFGGTLSGPIIKDKVHFFLVADIQQRQSAFGSPFNMTGNDAVDVGTVGFSNAQAQRFQDILRKYGISNAGNITAPDQANPDRNIFAKVTATPFENSHLELSYNYVNASQDVLIRNPTAPSFPTSPTQSGNLRDGYELSNSGYQQANTTNTGRVKLTSNFLGGDVSNELLAGFSYIRDNRQLPSDTPLIIVKAGDPGTKTNPCPQGQDNCGLGASATYLAAGGERFSQANLLDQDIYQLQDNVSISKDNHRFTLGTSNEFFKFRNVFLQAATGVWAFNSMDDFEAGKVAAFQRNLAVPGAPQDPGTAVFNVSQFGVYAQDDWSPFDNLTLSPGVRLDVPFLSSAPTNPALLPLGIDTGAIPNHNLLWSPRLGFNWDTDGTADTVVRGGMGIFSGRPPYVWVSNAYGNNGFAQTQLTCAGTSGVPAFTADPNAQPTDCAGGTKPPGAGASEIDYFDPNTKYPQNLRAALGADKRLPWGMVATADFMYSQDVNGWYTTDADLNYLGTDSDGRALYGTFNAATGRSTPSRPMSSSLVTRTAKVFNKNGAYTTNATFQLSKAIGRRYGISVAYTYSRSFDRISFTSSQAYSNFQFAPVDGDLENRNVRPSAFDRPHKITVTGTAALPYGFGLGLSYVGQSGTPYTWTVNGDVNGDGVSGNDLVFVPANPSQISLANPAQYADLQKFIDSQACLRDAKGGFVQRGACRNPWQDFVNLRVSWLSPELAKGQRIEVQWDIFNVLNLVNSNWGHFLQDAQFENASAFLRSVGYDTANKRPIYAFGAPQSVTSTIYSPTLSRWRMQFGARYTF